MTKLHRTVSWRWNIVRNIGHWRIKTLTAHVIVQYPNFFVKSICIRTLVVKRTNTYCHNYGWPRLFIFLLGKFICSIVLLYFLQNPLAPLDDPYLTYENRCGIGCGNSPTKIVCKDKVDAEIQFECTIEYHIFLLNVEASGQRSDRLSVFEANPRCRKLLRAESLLHIHEQLP